MRFDCNEPLDVVEESSQLTMAPASSNKLMPMLEPLAPKLVDDDLVEVALGQLLASSRLRSAVQLRRFLTFVVEESLAGRGDKLKAYTIATHALGRPVDFDPSKDPIVRVEATRLRAALTAYYADEGRGATIRFHMLPGSYRPMIEVRDPFASAAAPLAEVPASSVFELAPSQPPLPASTRPFWLRAALIWCAINTLLIGYALYALREHFASLNRVVQVTVQIAKALLPSI